MNFDIVLQKILNGYPQQYEKNGAIKTIVVCDPGVDDILMILQLLCSPQFDVVGIVSIEGNATCYQTVQNTLNLIELLGKVNIKIYPGSNYDISTPSQLNETAIYGLSGLDQVKIPMAINVKPNKKQGIDFICDTLNSYKCMIVSTANLTELSKVFMRLVTQNPEDLKNIIAISMMGGVINHTQEANWPVLGQRFTEANFGYNATASKFVFDVSAKYQIPIFLSPLDLTHSILASESDVVNMKEINSVAANLALQLITNVPEHYQKLYLIGPDRHYRHPLHDIHAVSCLLHPELYYGFWVRLALDDEIMPGQIKILNEENGNVFLLDMHYLYRNKFFYELAADIKKFYTLTN